MAKKRRNYIKNYPEGQRNNNPKELLPFKTGAYRIARETKVPILPIALKNTGKAMPIGGLVNFADIKMIIGEPFHVESVDQIPHLIEGTRDFLLKHL